MVHLKDKKKKRREKRRKETRKEGRGERGRNKEVGIYFIPHTIFTKSEYMISFNSYYNPERLKSLFPFSLKH